MSCYLRVWGTTLDVNELHRLKQSRGVECIVIDFGLTFDRKNAAQFSYFPPELLRQAGEVNCGIEVSYYDLG